MIKRVVFNDYRDVRLEAAVIAFTLKGPPGVIRQVQNINSYPGEGKDDLEAYVLLPSSGNDVRKAVADAINAFIDMENAFVDKKGRAIHQVLRMPLETRGGYMPQGNDVSPTDPPPKPSDSKRSADPR